MLMRAVTESLTGMPEKTYSVQEPTNQRQNSIAKVARQALAIAPAYNGAAANSGNDAA